MATHFRLVVVHPVLARMRNISVRVISDKEYAKLLNGPTRYHTVSEAELQVAPATVEIVTGGKDADHGGGPSPDGFVMNGSQMLGRIRIKGRVVGGVFTI